MANDISLQSEIDSIIELYSSGHIKEALNDTESLIIKYPDESYFLTLVVFVIRLLANFKMQLKALRKQ